jgi:hypothetical protein
MNITKFLITTASALAIVGTVGVAVAQNGLTKTPNSDARTNPTAVDAAATMQAAPMPATPMQADTSVAPASPMVNPETSMTPERAPQADRN